MGSVVGFAASIAAERWRGTLIRLATSPLTRSQILAGKAMACFVTCMLVQVLLIAIAIGMGSQIGSWPMLSVAVVCSSLGFVGIAMGLAPFADSEEGAAGIARAVPMILAMIGGGTIPLAFMPPFLETLSNVSPFKWAIVAVEGGMWRGFTAADMLLPCGILLGVGAVAFGIGVKRLRWE
jgi:ABC-2 type transport system permease protein